MRLKWERKLFRSISLAVTALCFALPCLADHPFFVTYTAAMEEPGEFEIANKSVTGKPTDGNHFLGSVWEFEYGAKPWWTTEFYLDAQTTHHEGTLYTGFRWENRFRLSPTEHWINPVLYFEYENLNGADKALLTVVGHDGVDDLDQPLAESRQETERELEAKLILDSSFEGWTLAENLIAEKNLQSGPYEFGYAVGIFRPLGDGSGPCRVCLGKVQAGVEMYGGLGTNKNFGLRQTSHYVGPTVAWTLPHGVALRVSPNFGITDTSARLLVRFGVSLEIEDLKASIRNFFR